MLTPRSTPSIPFVALRSRLASSALLAVTAYLLLERNHAEEIGGGLRAGLDVVRGDRQQSPLTWVAVALSGYLLVAAARLRQRA